MAPTALDDTSTNTLIGLILAISSGLLIGTSFVFKKLGLRKTQEDGRYGYLSSEFWWAGMVMMTLGEIANFSAYAFTPALLVTPLGALSVVVTAVLSTIFLKESLTIHGKIGCFLCVVGSVIIVFHAPQEMAHTTIPDFQNYALTPAFLTWTSFVIVVSAVLAIRVAPKHGRSSMMVYIAICSLVGSLSVVATQGIGAAIVHSATQPEDSQIHYWFFWVLLIFMICTLLVEVNFLNQALRLFNTAIVTPVYFVCFTTATIVSTAIFAQGYNAPPVSTMTGICGFSVVCSGVMLLQLSKPKQEERDEAGEETSVPGAMELRANPLQLIRDASMYHSRQHSAASSVLPQHQIPNRRQSHGSRLREEREADSSNNTLAEVVGSSDGCQVDPAEPKELSLTSLGQNLRVKRAVNLRTGETTEMLEGMVGGRNYSPCIPPTAAAARRISYFAPRFPPNMSVSPSTLPRNSQSDIINASHSFQQIYPVLPSPAQPTLSLPEGPMQQRNSPISVPVLSAPTSGPHLTPPVSFAPRFPSMSVSPSTLPQNSQSDIIGASHSVQEINPVLPSPAQPTLSLSEGATRNSSPVALFLPEPNSPS